MIRSNDVRAKSPATLLAVHLPALAPIAAAEGLWGVLPFGMGDALDWGSCLSRSIHDGFSSPAAPME